MRNTMLNKIKPFALGACILTGMISANTIFVGFSMLQKDFVTASASTLLNAMHENKLQAFASVAIIPFCGLVTASYFGWSAYKGAVIKSADSEKQEAVRAINERNAKCKGKIGESLKIIPALAIGYTNTFLNFTHFATQAMLIEHFKDPKKGILRTVWDVEKEFVMSVFRGAFSPKTAPLFSTLLTIEFVSAIVGMGLSNGEGPGK